MDQLNNIGIDAKGYGRIYKAIMRKKGLHILAKTIYSYFCAYAGNGTTAFPKRDKILHDLQINKDTLTKYISVLIDSGLIAKYRAPTGNIYTINIEVPCISETVLKVPQSGSVLKICNVKMQGFGTVPKLAMLDGRLTAQAKAIYAYFCSFAGAGTVAFPHKATIIRELGISSRTYYTHFSLLTEFEYVTVKQRKISGRFDVSEYYLNEMVDMSIALVVEKPVENSENIVDNRALSTMSEKLQSGEVMSEILQSEECVSEKLVHQNFGQPYIKNNTIRNSSTNNSFLDKEHEYNHQPPGCGDEQQKPIGLYSEKRVKELIGFSYLQSEARATVELKIMLNQFQSEEDRERFETCIGEVLKELPKQIVAFLNLKSEMIVIDGHEYSYARLRSVLIEKLKKEPMRKLYLLLCDKYKEILCVRPYIKKVVYNASIKNI